MRDTVYVLVFDGFIDHQVSLALTEVRRPGQFQVCCVAEADTEVVAASGLSVRPQLTAAELDPARAALLVAPGGHAWERGLDAFHELVHTVHCAGAPVAAIGQAVLAPARAGLLRQRRHTGPAPDYLRAFAPAHVLEQYDPGVPAVSDDGLTTAGGFAGTAFALEVIRTLDLYDSAEQAHWYRCFGHDPAASVALRRECAA